jgi:hypothetical protein
MTTYEYIELGFDFGDLSSLNSLSSVGYKVVHVAKIPSSQYEPPYVALLERPLEGKAAQDAVDYYSKPVGPAIRSVQEGATVAKPAGSKFQDALAYAREHGTDIPNCVASYTCPETCSVTKPSGHNPYAVWVDNKLAYDPHEKQIAFHSNPAIFRLYGGAKGGGKSLCLLWEAITFCQNIPGCHVLLLRRTFPDLNKTLMDHFSKKIPSAVYGGPRNWNRNDHVVTFPNGSKLWFGACQHEHDVYDYNGGEYVFIGIDEATEWTYEMFQYLTLQNRCPIKIDKNGKPVVPCMALASNPGGIGSDWIEALFIGKKNEKGELVRNMEIAKKYTHGKITKYDPSRYAYIFSSVFDNPV